MSRGRESGSPRRESEPNVIHLYGVRGLYLSIFRKRIWEGDTEEDSQYEASWITEEDSKFYDRNLEAIEDAIKYVGDTDKNVKGKTGKRGFIEPLVFGEETGLPIDDFGKDVFVVKSKKRHKRPRIIDADGELIAEDDQVGRMNEAVKSGDYFDVILRLYGYDNKSVGINCEIMLIRFRKSGDALGGGREYGGDDFEAPDDDFERSNGGSSRSDRGSSRRDSGRDRDSGRGRDRGDDNDRDDDGDGRRSRSDRGRDEGSGRERGEGRRERGRGNDDSDSRDEGRNRRSRGDRNDDGGDERDDERGRDRGRYDDEDRGSRRGRGRDDDGGSDRGSRRGREPDPDRDDHDNDGGDGDERPRRGRR